MNEFSSPADFAGRTVLVCGARVAGASAARALLKLGATALVTDSGPDGLGSALPSGARFIGSVDQLPEGIDAVVTSPGLRPDNPLLLQAGAAGLPVFGELEFAWRIRGNNHAPWLMVTGTNGKTTTVRMLESILRAAGLSALAVGNVGVPIIDAVLAEPPYDVLAVEASSFQLFHSQTLAPRAGALLNLAADHLDWHGTMAEYAAAKHKVWDGELAIGNADDPAVARLLDASGNGARQSFTIGEPAAGQFGVRDGVLIDRFGAPLLPADEVRPPGSHNVANALAAAALAEACGVGAESIAAGLRSFVPDRHRNEFVAEVAGVEYIDDSKATNPHAAAASLAAYDSIVWIAGGQLKGAPVDELVAQFGPRLRAAVLLGADRLEIAHALARHAPDLPVIIVSRNDDGAMSDVVAAAASLAAAGDAVLLAPAAASLDMYPSYSARGQAFADAVAQLPGSAASTEDAVST
ncbi:MAG: UDP-N-acetylmuramoylalanine--D-glutamate ligase [Pseudonocardiales bacterium]|jgi:UDP-N-acetylmuramoylalanine--D-glutamate ligase|nr:UDP-N-acetylmuramoylalanine--D-glutamate ligase [Pseudonocardiales bacterium]